MGMAYPSGCPCCGRHSSVCSRERKEKEIQAQISTLTAQLDKCMKALENPATKSAITFLEAYFADRPCDSDAVSHCVKCNTNYLLSEIALASVTLAELEAGKGREG